MKTPSSSSCRRTCSFKNWRVKKQQLLRGPVPYRPYGNLKKSFEEKVTSTNQSPLAESTHVLNCHHCGAKNSLEFDNESAVCVECACRQPALQCFMLAEPYNSRTSGGYSLIKKHLYEKKVYFRQVINDIRGERNGKCPADVQIKVAKQLHGIPPVLITPIIITSALKQLKLTKYNCYRVQLARRLSGGMFQPVVVLHKHWRVFFHLFQKIEQVYPYIKKRVAPKRKIFFNYSYLFCRLSQLVGRPDYYQYVPRLGSVSARVIQGRLWRAVCARINLPWHPTQP